jgi:two-component system phosphate regulon sensor histidine kinase PhoR
MTNEQALMAAMLKGMVEGIVAFDEQDRILFCNKAACDVLGVVDLDVPGKTLEQLNHVVGLKQLINQARACDAPVMQEMTFDHGKGELILGVHASPFSDGNSSGAMLVLHNISDLRRLERIRRDFVANVSHELKTPLTSIKGYVETLLSGAIHDEKNNTRFLRKIEDNVGRLINLVQDLLALARIEEHENQIQTQALDWQNIVDAVLSRHEGTSKRKGLKLIMNEPRERIVVMGEHESMTQVLDNLLDNAIKYTPFPGEVRVTLSKKDGFGILTVEDTGLGIPAEDLDRIFERFYRVDKARSREVGGTGLGLSIVKHLVSAMHGHIAVESQVGRGSKFTVTLHLANHNA